MQFDHIVKKRKSVREFSKKKPNWKHILDAIDSTIQNPFAGNLNNIKFLIIEEEHKIKSISEIAEQPWISQSKTLVIICTDDTHLEDKYGERGRIYSRQQAGAAIQTFLLKLTDLGLSSCWIGAYSDEILKQTLDIPQHIQIEAIIPIGYENPRKKVKKPEKIELENVLYWEKWDQWKRPPLIKESRDRTALK